MNFNEISLPLLAVHKESFVARFIGSCTLIGEGQFMTCSHVIQDIKEEESLGVMFDEDNVLKPTSFKSHPKYDFAGGFVNGVKSGMKIWVGEIWPGMDIQSIGYVREYGSATSETVSMAPRLLKGYVVRIAPKLCDSLATGHFKDY